MKKPISIRSTLYIHTPNSKVSMKNPSHKDILIEAMKAIAINEGLNRLEVDLSSIMDWLDENWVKEIKESFYDAPNKST